MKRLVILPAALFCAFAMTSSAKAATRTSVRTGSWSTASTWDTGVPGTGDAVVIASTHTVSLSANASIGSGAGANVTVQSGGILDLSSFSLTANTLTIDNGGEVKQGGTGTSPSGTITTRSYAPNSTYTFNGTQAGLSGTHPAYGNLNFAPTPASAGSFGLNLSVAGNLTIDLGSNQEVRFATGTVARTQTITGDLNVVAGIVVGSNGSSAAGSATVTISGKLNITGGTFRGTNDVGAATFNIAGNVSNGGTWQQDDGSSTGLFTINMNGTNSQDITGPSPISFENLTISNPNGVSLSENVTVTGTLGLTSGDLDTGSNTLFMGNGATSTGIGDVRGSVSRTDIGSTTRSFGNPDVQITEATGTVGSITVKLVKGSTPNDFSNAVKRIYTITANNGTLVNATVRLRYIDSELNTNTESTLDLWRKDAILGWQDKLQTARHDDTVGEQNWVELALVTQFSDWVISGPTAPTDVAMMSFKATRYDKQVHLDWQTGYEVGNVGFNIYREKNGQIERITPEPVAGSALIAGPRVELKAGLAYSWWDDVADCGSANADCPNLRYWIEDIDLSGRTSIHGPFGVSEAVVGDQLEGRDPSILSKHKSKTLSALGTQASLAQTADAATFPVEPVSKPAKPTGLAGVTVRSGVASQPAVKLSIQRAGWYRVEKTDLLAAGLPSDVDPEILQLLADGTEVPILVTPGNASNTTVGKVVGAGTIPGKNPPQPPATVPAWTGIEFYGVGIDSPSTVNHVYWLVVGTQPGLRVGTSNLKGGPPAPSSFTYTVERRDRTVYFPALKNGGAEKWFGPLIYDAQPVDQTVILQNVATPSGALMLVSLQGFTNAAHAVRVIFNGVEVGTMRFTGLQKSSNKFVIQPGNVHEGANQIQLIGPAGTSDLSLVDFVQVNYSHSNIADNNALRLPASAQQAVMVVGFTNSAIRVMDVTDANSPIELQTTVDGAPASKTATGATFSVTVTAPKSGLRTLLAFASDQQKTPAQIVANQPSNYRDPSQRGDYLVITRNDLIGSFGPLVDLRSSQGLTPRVIDVEDIYDEFSFGNKSPEAIKDFLAYAKTNWALAPRFVVLGGDATYDPKRYLGLGNFDVVPTRLVETTFNEAATDDWFVDVNGDSLPDIAIGRLPVRTTSEASLLVTKLVSYDSSLPSDNVVLVTDRNSSYDFEDADTRLMALIPGGLTVTDIRRGQLGDANARTQLLAALNQGARIVNYYGHGSTTVWTDAPMLSSSDASGLTNQDHLSLVVSMTCLNGYFFTNSIESLGESLLKAPGGAIAVWASSGMTDPVAQTVMSRDAINQLLNGANLTIGEVAALAKASVTNLDVRRTWILFGDPATRLKGQAPSRQK